jgi:uncharacterized protein YciI
MKQQKCQFIYVLKPVPHLRKEENWTEREEAIVGRHFNFLKKMLAEGKLILAGKTGGLDEKTFGIVIIEVDSADEALAFMNSDPGVAEGVMTAELYPYSVAIMRK